MHVQPYLFFGRRCDGALENYREALGAQVSMIMRFGESPEPPPADQVPGGWEDKVMHASFRMGETEVMASDGCSRDTPGIQGFSLSLTLPDGVKAEELFAARADGGQVRMPLAETFGSPRFGMAADRFGVTWMVNVAPAGA